MSRLKRSLAWIASHKLLTLLLVLLLFVLIQAATIPWLAVPRLGSENPGQTALMRQRLDEAGAGGKRLVIRQSWVPLSRLPKHVTDAIIVAEDGTFYDHEGFDWFEVRESIEKNLKERRAARGGSTITQQLAKNLYLSTSKDPLRKAKEIVITMLLERNLTKRRILELYVNVIEWGSGIFGIDAAARRYFGKPAPALTLEESLRLAAVIPSPLRHRPDVNSRYVLRRAEIIRSRMQSRRFVPFPADDEADVRGGPSESSQVPADTVRRTQDGMDREAGSVESPGPAESAAPDGGALPAGGPSEPGHGTPAPAQADSAGGGERSQAWTHGK